MLHVTQPVEAGVARVVLDLITDQVGRGWEVWLACPTDGWLPLAARAAGARVLPWHATRQPGPGVVREVRRLSAILREVDPAVVHLHSSKAGLAGRLAVRGRRPTAFQPHAWSFLATGGPLGAASHRWEQWAARWTDLVVAVSEAEASRTAEAGISAPVVVAPNGVDVDRWAPRDRAHARAQLGLGAEPIALCAGRLAHQKGQDILVDLWPSVRARVADSCLLLVGDGPTRQSLEAAAGPGIVFGGASADLAPWYAAADVVVLPSRWEGMALVPLEAMASGRSVVATDVDGMREALEPDAGEVVSAGDRTALADAVSRRLADSALCAAEGASGRSRAVAYFDVRRCAAVVGDAVAALAHAPGRSNSTSRSS
ncbi:glycosyltransferase [Geodermatophilus maliterrae]|uniref:Glycosyltransferase n=1 Tax=Geodermatophilus maliterrae TaxID=3162531 RepID=A0ABV3XIX9_9ACTN